MPDLIRERVCADIDGEIVVFLIGLRLNKLWKFWKFLPVLRAMPRMLDELSRQPELGLLSFRPHFGLRSAMIVQYWKSAAHLTAYARAADRAHLPAWQAFNAAIGGSGDVGIWHETYVVPAGHAESIYANMPPHGLGRFLPLVPAKGRHATAARRLRGVGVSV